MAVVEVKIASHPLMTYTVQKQLPVEGLLTRVKDSAEQALNVDLISLFYQFSST